MADGAQDSSTTAAYFCHLGISFYISKLLPAPACPAATDSKTLFLDADAHTYGYILGGLQV